MRAVLIDPFTREISEVDYTDGIEQIYSLLQCEIFTVVRVGERDSLFLDDEGLFVPAEKQAYFLWAGSMQPFAGRGLVIGADDEGESAAAEMSLDEARAKVTWLDSANVNPDDYLGWHIQVF